LTPFDLKHTYLFRQDAAQHDLATGYKIGFLRPMAFDAPIYRGNTPAGYFISNAEDMEKWLRLQLGTYPLSESDQQIIQQTHIPDRSVPPLADGSSYAGGWQVYQSGSGEPRRRHSRPHDDPIEPPLHGLEHSRGLRSYLRRHVIDE
jgi:putative pyoverdin transport system ATP-binding/permease protein